MITNGGYGGVHHALSYGIPVVVAGETSDKAEVAARVEHAGVGLNLGTANPSADQIAAAVRGITSDCHAAAHLLSREMAATKPLDVIARILTEELSRQEAISRS
jgi:UDP:flavonoid glycosyltransferase YjiC (YdhE family)